jgi:hypothetical protein
MTSTIDPRHLVFLDSLKSAEFEHVSRKARDHLIGVHDILQRWGCAPDVCVAGLFHNIYGTESFKPQAVDLGQRHQVSAAIGASAEAIAYLFCVSRRMSFFGRQAAHAPAVWDEVHKCRAEVSPAQLAALIDLEAANLVEQYDEALQAYPERLAQSVTMMQWMLAQPSPMSPAARAGLQDLLARIEHDRCARTPA